MWVCKKCKSNNVQQRAWVDLNTENIVDYIDDGGEADFYCMDCEDHQRVEQEKDAPVVGYQVWESNGSDVHPENEASSYIFVSRNRPDEIVREEGDHYFVMTIYRGDIGDPTFI